MTDKQKPTGLALLREPFPPHQISKLPKPYKKDSPKGKCSECGGYHGLPAVHLDYVGHAALTDRLLDCDPLWYWEPVAIGPNGLPAMDGNGGLWIRLFVCGHSRLGYGHPDGKNNGDAIKEAIGDAMRNAAMRFGAALDLWHKGDLHGDDDTQEPAQPQEPEKPKPTTNDIANKLIKRFGEMSTLADLEAFTAPDTPAGKAWSDLGKADEIQAARVRTEYDKREEELKGQ